MTAVLSACVGCRSTVPQPSTRSYDRFLSAYFTGLAALQVGDDVRAETGLAEAVVLAPGEPAAWANWGVLALRQRSYDQAADRLNHAHTLAPRNSHIEYLLGLLESERGNTAAAITHLRAAVADDARNLRALYQLASEIERQADPSSEEQFEQLMRQILVAEPGNVAAELELGRVAAKRGDDSTLRTVVKQIATQGADWPLDVRQQFDQLQAAAEGGQLRAAATRSMFLRNVLMQVPSFRDSLADLKPQPGEGAQPMLRLVTMVNPPSRPAPADFKMRFSSQPVPALAGPWTWAGAISLSGDGAPVLAASDAKQLRLATGATLPFPGGSGGTTPESVLPIDFNYDFKTDLVLAGARGVRLFRQESPNHFTDVSAMTKLPRSVLDGDYSGAWAMDIEADGDLDILLGSRTGLPVLLRNNGDGTFAATHPFPGVSAITQVVWADLNGDGNPDAAMLDAAERLHIFLNRRSGIFTEISSPMPEQVQAITAADLGAEGVLNLVALTGEGSIVRLSAPEAMAEKTRWDEKEITRTSDFSNRKSEVRISAADFDNNGGVDLLISGGSGAALWLQEGSGAFTKLSGPLGSTRLFAAADLASDGRLQLVGLDATGGVVTAQSQGTQRYQWQTIRPRARQATGDQRINSFGIGGEIEVRAGLLVEKQPISGPQLHFGLGDQKQVDVARILWPNGTVRAEFALKADQQIVTEQRLKGSCPFLFAWDGKRMQFVKDSVPWGSAIGLRINALGAAKIAATEEWYKIGREQLAPRNGMYDLRITGELWETYYYDSMQLMTVDHPADTEIYTDERFDVPPVKLAVTAVSPPQPIYRAVDDQGKDVTAILAKLDGTYLDTFGRGQYQGVTRDHYVEIELPAEADSRRPLWLIAKGWLHPSDSSINVALGQSAAAKPRWLSLEIPDGHGSWRSAKSNLGFPAGRNKTCLIDISGLPRRMRLRTNLEIYWDQIAWARGLPQTPLLIQRLQPTTADLHYRGFSSITQTNSSSPELPQYERLAGSSPRWRDLEGFYTRFGDVRELLRDVDDRYVIMNAGDEMELHFAAAPLPAAGWVRDYVLAGDGWIKDGDYNSSHSQTVLPYPHHARRDYDEAPGTLENDWVYRHHAADWQTYQTRYVSSRPFARALTGVER